MPGPGEPVVVNATPLISLAAVGQLDLLPKLYARVVVPEAVIAEVSAPPYDATPILQRMWIERGRLQRPPLPDVVAALDPGETSVIMIALQERIKLVLMDERKGRRVAAAAGLAVSGTVGVILRAKLLGHLQAVRPVLNGLSAAGLWLADELIERAAREVGE
ncbi:MAG TPA: DUF3368 domain-containing protein [Spirochaetia bacterium]